MTSEARAVEAAAGRDILRLLERDARPLLHRAQRALKFSRLTVGLSLIPELVVLVIAMALASSGIMFMALIVASAFVPLLVASALFHLLAASQADHRVRDVADFARDEYGIRGFTFTEDDASVTSAISLDGLHPEMTETRALLAARA